MNLGEALLELKARRSELVRLQELRENSFRFKEGGKRPEDDFGATSGEIAKLAEDIRGLKMAIENTNHSSVIDTPDGKMTIAEAIHLVADMRSELSCLQKLKDSYHVERWMRKEEATEYEFQLPQRELLKKISELEAKKVRMDSFLSSWNWKVNIKN